MIRNTLLAFALIVVGLWCANRVAQWGLLRYVEGVLFVIGGGE